MAKTTAPLLSFGATGSIAKTAVYASWRGVPYVRRHVVPANPRTAAQTTTRATFAMLREFWKLLPALARAPWDAFASGRQFLGLNAFIGENIRVIRGETDMQNFIGSPGARGGLAATSVTPSTGAGSGEIDVDFVSPSPPDGWTLEAVQAMAFIDQNPTADFIGVIAVGENTTTLDTVTLTGLGSAEACVVVGWLKWSKPNGDVAYSVGLTGTATSGA